MGGHSSKVRTASGNGSRTHNFANDQNAKSTPFEMQTIENKLAIASAGEQTLNHRALAGSTAGEEPMIKTIAVQEEEDELNREEHNNTALLQVPS